TGNTLESVSSPGGYLFRAAINEARQRFRTHKRRMLSDEDVELVHESENDCSAGEKDMQERLLEAMTELDDDDAELLHLWSVHGYTDAEIAEMLGKSRNAVAVGLHRAKSRLKGLLNGGSKEGGEQ